MRNINSRTDSNTPLENRIPVIGAGIRIVSVYSEGRLANDHTI